MGRIRALVKKVRERGASWFVKWARQTAGSRYVHVKSFEEALERAVLLRVRRTSSDQACRRRMFSPVADQWKE